MCIKSDCDKRCNEREMERRGGGEREIERKSRQLVLME